jgi:hypothetical protein
VPHEVRTAPQRIPRLTCANSQILRRVSSHGMCYMELTGNNLTKSSSAAFELHVS